VCCAWARWKLLCVGTSVVDITLWFRCSLPSSSATLMSSKPCRPTVSEEKASARLVVHLWSRPERERDHVDGTKVDHYTI
jgi:hypothetical protein